MNSAAACTRGTRARVDLMESLAWRSWLNELSTPTGFDRRPARAIDHCAAPQPSSSIRFPLTFPRIFSSRSGILQMPQARALSPPRIEPCSVWYSSLSASHARRFLRASRSEREEILGDRLVMYNTLSNPFTNARPTNLPTSTDRPSADQPRPINLGLPAPVDPLLQVRRFGPDRRVVAVPRIHRGLIGQREQLRRDGVDDLRKRLLVPPRVSGSTGK
jgi:hypothetical protein